MEPPRSTRSKRPAAAHDLRAVEGPEVARAGGPVHALAWLVDEAIEVRGVAGGGQCLGCRARRTRDDEVPRHLRRGVVLSIS
jgi:hypothetical protein